MPSRSPDLSGASDQEVVAQALEGLGEAYTELVHRYNARIFWNVRDVVGGPPERTVDLVQIAWMKVFGALDTYRPELPFQPWIIQIARNAAADYVRRRPFDSPSLPDNVTPSHLDQEPLDWRDPDDTPTPDRRNSFTMLLVPPALPPRLSYLTEI